TLERSWAQPFTLVPAGGACEKLMDADPCPKPGVRVLKPMPVGRARQALRTLVSADPVVATVASVGAGDGDFELNITLENRASRRVTRASGVAYGFSALGMPAPTNKDGSEFVAFSVETRIEPRKKASISQTLHYAGGATLAIAHVDAIEYAD